MNENSIADSAADWDWNVSHQLRWLPYPPPPTIVLEPPRKWLAQMSRLCWLSGLTLNDATSLLLEQVVGCVAEGNNPGHNLDKMVINTFVEIRRSLLALHQWRSNCFAKTDDAIQNTCYSNVAGDLELPKRISVPLSPALNQKLYEWGEEIGSTRGQAATLLLEALSMDKILTEISLTAADKSSSLELQGNPTKPVMQEAYDR